MKILVVGGMHGNEPLGIKLVEQIQKRPIKKVDVVMANELAIKRNCRFIKADLNRSFPGSSSSKEYEPKRAAQLLLQATNYDVVLDFHNTYCPDNNCGFIGETANKVLSDVAWLLGLDKLIVADYNCINKYANNCLSVEISLNSDINDVAIWYERLQILSLVEKFEVKSKIKKFRFVYRITLADAKKFNLAEENLIAFKPMPVRITQALGIDPPAYPIFIADKYTPYNYGGILKKL